MKKIFWVILIMLLIIPSTFALYSGTIGSGSGWVSTTFDTTTHKGDYGASFSQFQFNDIENSAGATSYVHFDTSGTKGTFDSGAPQSASTSFTLYIGTNTTENRVATGTIGYQRNFDTTWPIPNEIAGYQYLLFDNWNITGKSGDSTGTLEYNATLLYHMYYAPYSENQTGSNPSGHGGFYMYVNPSFQGFSSGYHTFNRNVVFINSYTADQDPDTYVITGTITKFGQSGPTYPGRGMVFNAASGALLTSESSSSSNAFPFTITPPMNIIVASRDSVGNIWNSTTLVFTGGSPPPTPTPTPGSTTVIPTGVPTTGPVPGTTLTTPGTYTNLTMHFYDDTTLAVVGTVYASVCNTQGGCLYGTSNSEGILEFDMIAKGTEKISAFKNGYQNYEQTRTLQAGDESTSHYLVPAVNGQNTTPAAINITLTIRNSNGGALIPGAYVSLSDILAGTAAIAGITDSNGQVTFHSVPNTPAIGGIIQKNGYNDKQWWLGTGQLQMADVSETRYLDSTTGAPGTITPTVTPTPAPYDNIILSISPTSINLGDSASLTLTATSTAFWEKASMIAYYVTIPSGTESNIGTFKYNATSGYYDKRAGSTGAFIPTALDGRTLSVTPSAAGNHKYRVYVSNFTAGNVATGIGTDSVDIMVGGAGQYGSLTMTLYAFNGATTVRLSNYNLNLTEDITGTVTELGTVGYDTKKSLARGSSYTLKGNKTGLMDGTYTFTVPTDPGTIEDSFASYVGVPLYPAGAVLAGNTTLTVRATDAGNYMPIPNVELQESDANSSWSTITKYTGASGQSTTFTIPHNIDYQVTGIKTGYCSVSETGNTGTQQYIYIDLVMKSGSCIAPNVSPSVTPTTTVQPGTTLIPGYGGNVTPYPASVCNVMPANPTFVDIVMNGLACNGFKDSASQNLALAFLIIIVSTLILGKVAGGIGILGGAIIGMLITIVMGLLPFWIVVVLIIIAGLIIASKLIPGGN